MKSLSTQRSLIALTAALLFAPSTVAVAQPPAPEAPGGYGLGDGGPGLFLERMIEALELSDGQIAAIEEKMAAHRVTTAGLKAEARLAHESMERLEESMVFDETAIREAAGKAAAVHVELAVERARFKSDVHQLLTPEQQQKAAELKAERRGRRGHFGDRHGGRRGRAPRAWR